MSSSHIMNAFLRMRFFPTTDTRYILNLREVGTTKLVQFTKTIPKILLGLVGHLLDNIS